MSVSERSAATKIRPVLFWMGYLFLLLGVLEITLRFQQAFGPLYDLEFTKFLHDSFLSETLNHKPSLEQEYNQDGIQTGSDRAEPATAGRRPFKILFMGDSFIQGYPPAQTIPEMVRVHFRKTPLKDVPMILWNAGYSSYAPAIYIVQAKRLIPRYWPDLVVVDIDESDLIDDFALYRHLIVRDPQGRITAVRVSPPLRTKMRGYETLRRRPFYLFRLLSMWRHKINLYFLFEVYNRKYKSKYFRIPLAETSRRFSFNLAPGYDLSPEIEKKYEEETVFFKSTVRELARTLVELTGSPEKILFLYHPHLYQLVPDPRGHLWKRLVPRILKEVSQEYGMDFFDASRDLKKAFGQNPESYYQKNDMHYNRQGMELYSYFVAQKLWPKVESLEPSRSIRASS